MTEKAVIKQYEDLEDGELVLFFGVHAVRWNHAQWGDPAIAVCMEEDARDATIQRLTDALRGILDCANVRIDDPRIEKFDTARALLEELAVTK